MKFWQALMDPMTAPIIGSAVLTGLAIVTMCAVLSVMVVLKRLAFVGQGVSHSAFGGIGVAAVLSTLIGATGWLGQGGLGEFAIVLLFCIGAALLMAAVPDRKTMHIDTGIGLLLVASMALGGILVEVARQIAAAKGVSAGARSWESVLFGSLLTSSWTDVLLAWVITLFVLATLAWFRRPLLFWAFDEQAAPAFGVPAKFMRTILMVLLAIAVVTSMKLAGVVPATALLVLPGAIALKRSARLARVITIAIVVGIAGLLIGLLTSVEFNIQPGPCIVLVMTAGFGLAIAIPKRSESAA